MIRSIIVYAALVIRIVPALFRSHREQATVKLALRQQLATYSATP
jgi:hypothetical protein